MWAINLIGNTLWGVSRVLWRVSCRGLEHLPTDPRGFIVVANHQTYADPVWLGVQIPRKTRYLAWDEAFRWPLVGTFLHLVGAWPLQIERGNPTAVRRSVQWLREGGALVMFPEGGRCFEDGKISRFKAGAFRIAIEAEVPVVPATIRGGEKVWPQGWRFPRLGRVEVEFHPAVEIECQPGEEPRACARRVSETFFEIVAAGLEESNARQQSGSAKPPKLPSLGKEG
jgi:1-acyl-sn-glycerol-3-phosphate acyltransferase